MLQISLACLSLWVEFLLNAFSTIFQGKLPVNL